MSESDLEPIRALHAAGRTREAWLACKQLLARFPDRTGALAVAGSLALKLGDLESAEADLRASTIHEPRNSEALFNWGNALRRLGRSAEAVAVFIRVLEIRPDSGAALNNLGNALFESRELEAAVATFRRALELAPQAAHLQRNLGTALHAQGQARDALVCFEKAVTCRPGWTKALQSVATTAAECGEWGAVVEACRTWLKHHPANVEALGLMTIALDELGQGGAADELLDFERLLRCVQLDVPPGFGSLSAFNAELTAQALNHPTLHVPASDDPRYHCPTLRMTAEFCMGSSGASAALALMVASAIDGYVKDLIRALPEHPFVAGAPQSLQLISWATVLDGEGNLEPHVHYASYVSAVYYPKIPLAMGSVGQGAGYLEFGGRPARFPCRVARPTRAVEPREGMLVLFPSYFYHRTAPFNAPEPRIAIAFDTTSTYRSSELRGGRDA